VRKVRWCEGMGLHVKERAGDLNVWDLKNSNSNRPQNKCIGCRRTSGISPLCHCDLTPI